MFSEWYLIVKTFLREILIEMNHFDIKNLNLMTPNPGKHTETNLI